MTRRSLVVVLAVGLVVTLAVAFAVSPFASSSPDGLEKVSMDQGFSGTATDHDLADGPLADYAVDGVDGRVSTGLAGVIGVVVTLAVGAGLFTVARRARRRTGGRRPSGTAPARSGRRGVNLHAAAAPAGAGGEDRRRVRLRARRRAHPEGGRGRLRRAARARPRDGAGVGVTARQLGARLVFEVPFLTLAVLLPFIGGGDRVDWGPFEVSVEGTWAAWNILAKATLGMLAATVLAATTDPAALLAGLRRLRCPTALLAIAGFMTRYLDVLLGQSRRLQIARISRGDDPRWLWQGRAIAHGAGSLFVRSYERGERVALAMAARGYTGVMPDVFGGRAATRGEWIVGLLIPAAAAAVTTAAVLT